MATRIESGQMQLRSVGPAPIQQPEFRQVQPIGFQVAAQAQSQMAQVIQRMSESLFKEAGRRAEQEGLRYAAENPLTAEEIELAKAGAITEPTGRIFDDAFRKARSLQLASHFEVEAVNEMTRMMPDIEAGRMTAEQVILKLREQNSGLTSSLAKLDPGAAIKLNATLATHGNSIVKKALDVEVKRAKEKDLIKLQLYAGDIEKLLPEAIRQSPDLVDALEDKYRQDVLIASISLGDASLQAEYSGRFEKAARQAKIDVLTQEILGNDMVFANELAAISQLRQGNFVANPRYNKVMASLVRQDPKAVEDIIKIVRAESSARYQKQQQLQAESKRDREIAANDLLREYYSPNTLISRKNEIADQLVSLRVMSIEQTERFLNPQQPPGDMFTFTAIKAAIDRGDLAGYEAILGASVRAGMNGEQFSQLYERSVTKVESPEQADAMRFIRAAAGVPDVRSTFATKDQEHQIAKAEAIERRYRDMVQDYRRQNPGAAVPFRDLSRQAVDQYNATERADAQKQQAETRLQATVKALVDEKKLPATVTIDADTNIDDLVARYKNLRPGDIDELKRLQRTLRGVSR